MTRQEGRLHEPGLAGYVQDVADRRWKDAKDWRNFGLGVATIVTTGDLFIDAQDNITSADITHAGVAAALGIVAITGFSDFMAKRAERKAAAIERFVPHLLAKDSK